MTDTDVNPGAAEGPKPIRIHISKADADLDIITDNLPQPVYEEALRLGLEAMANRGMTKVTGLKDMEGEELAKARAAALKIAEKNVKAMMEGTIKLRGQPKTKTTTPKAVMDEARRQAKLIVKAVLKEKGYKMKDITAKELTAAANAYVNSHPDILAKAEAEIARRNAATAEDIPQGDDINSILAGISAQPAPKAEKQLSAASAGKTRKRKTKGGEATA